MAEFDPLIISDFMHTTGVEFSFYTPDIYGDRGGTVVKVLCYKSEGRWLDSTWCHWNFSLT